MSFLGIFYQRFSKYTLSALIVLFVILGGGTYFKLVTSADSLNSNELFILLYIDILLLALITAIVVSKIQRIIKVTLRKSKENRFHKQIITMFSVVTIIPSACVFIFAIIFFNIGIETLFKAPVQEAMNNANQVATIHIENMKIAMGNYINGVAERINECVDGLNMDIEKMEKILSEETSGYKIDAVVMQSNGAVIAKSPFSMSLQFEALPKEVLLLNNKDVMSWESNSSVVSLQIINRDLGIYLLASEEIDKKILDHKHKIKTAVMEYTDIATKRAGLKVTFMAFFSIITILLLLISVLVGFVFANWILKPVNKLILAAKNVSLGDYKTTIKTDKFKNEWDILVSSFNIMISRLEQQRQQLIISNTQSAWRDIARKIAHEIKNPLTPIQLSAERLKRKYQNEIRSNPEVFTACIDTIIRQVSCIGTLVTEFSDFARMPQPKMEDTDIIKLIRDTILIQSNAHKDIAFHQSFDKNEFMCKIDPVQINQVMMNVLQNSINAIVENNTNNNKNFRGNISVNFTVNSNICCITIEDDGPGFSSETITKALEPYYTTREAGNGLGLAIVYKIITEHGGKIKLEKSETLGGASVFIEIPYIY